MADEQEDVELSRYLAYLQRLMTGDGPVVAEPTESISEWISSVRARLQGAAPAGASSAIVDAYLELAANYRAKNEFDSFHAAQIFEPVLADVSEACARMGVGPKRSVIHANSPATTVTPTARPSSEAEHLLFAGAGTFAFCNYWGKAIADLVTALVEITGQACLYSIDLATILSSHRQLLLLPVQLAAYFATHETLLGFGQVTQAPGRLLYRAELVQAMEVFAIGHEFGHFIIEERRGTTDTSGEMSVTEEYEADLLGFVICRNVGSVRDNWLAYSGSGPLVFLQAFRICEDARELLRAARLSTTHPPTTQRIDAIEHFIQTSTHPEECERVLPFIEEYQALLHALRVAVGRELEITLAQIQLSENAV